MPLMCWLENLSLIRLRHVCLRMRGVVSLPVSVLSVGVTACKVWEISEALRFLCGSIWSSMLSIGWNGFLVPPASSVQCVSEGFKI